MTFRWSARPLPSLLAAAAILAGSFAAASSLHFLILSHWDGPVKDFWNFIPVVKAIDEGKWNLASFFRSHGGHRLFVSRLLYLVDYRFFSGTNTFLNICSLALQGVTGGILAACAWKERRHITPQAAAFLAGITGTLVFSGTQMVNFARGWNVHWFLTCTGITLCLASFAKLRTKSADERPRGAFSAGWLALTIAAATVATYSMANGALAWPILLLLGLHLRVGPRRILILAVAGGLAIGAYLVDYPSGGGRSLAAALSRPAEVAERMAVLFGAPLSWKSRLAGTAIGAAGILAALFFLLRFALRRLAVREAEIVYSGLLAFTLGSGLLMTLGRIWVSDASWNASRYGARYQTVVLLFWLCVIALAMLRVSAKRSGSAVRRGVFMALVLLWSALVVLPAALEGGRRSVAHAERYRRANTAILVGIQEPSSYSEVLPLSDLQRHRDSVAAYRRYLLERRLGVFSTGRQDYLGFPLRAKLSPTDPDECRGAVSRTRFLDEASPQEIQIEGWAWDLERDAQPRLILISDEAGRIIGLGPPDQRGLPWARPRHEAARWTAFARPVQPGSRIEVWALLGRRSLCHIAAPQPF